MVSFGSVRTLMLFLLALAGSLAVSSSAQNRLSCEWSHSIAVTATSNGGAHSDEIRVDLTAADFPTGYTMSANGDDLRVLTGDNTTAIPFFISRWDAIASEATVFIRAPAIPAGGSATYNFFLGNEFVANASDATTVFPVTGLRVLSRVSSADPTDAASAYTALRNASSTTADVVRNSVDRINNRTLGGTNGNYGLCISTLLNIPPAQAGNWSFRAGMDYGRGGHLRIQEADLETDWNTDLWWANNWANPDVLEGSRTLTSGWHRIETLGFEGCCDGPIEIQARAPGGSYVDLTTSNFDLRASICSNLTITTSTVEESCPIGLDVSKVATAFADPLGTDFAIPGTTVTYEIAVANTGQRVDDTTIDIRDALPADARLIVDAPDAFELIEGSTPSGLAFTWGGFADDTDDVEFSIDGTDFSYTPNPDPTGTDEDITHVRFVPRGSLGPADNTDQPSFTLRLRLIIQ